MLKMRDLLQEGRNIQQVFKKNVLNEETFLQKAFSGKIKPTTKEQVESILKALDVKNYTVNSDLTVDVRGNVDVSSKKLKVIPVNFRMIRGYFWCYNNNITTLEGAPQKVGGSFHCYNNNLTTLEGAPQKVGRDFWCQENNLTTLQGAPKEVGDNFMCYNNNVTTLEGAPQKVGRGFWCNYNNLTTLEGAPQKVGGHFICDNNNLTTLEGAPQKVGGHFHCQNNKKQFTKSDVQSVSKVAGKILVK